MYSIDLVDPGGETYRGIARKRHPTWPGWRIIDKEKPFENFPENLYSKLRPLVQNFYKKEFWDKLKCEKVSSFETQQELFDTAVNMGKPRAVKFLQRTVNILNRNQTLYEDVEVDGVIGEETLNAIQKLLKYDDVALIVLWMNVLQGAHYAQIIERNSVFERYARGWMKRVKLTKT